MSDITKAVVITGCSTGLGRESAIRLARGGFTVYAGVRNEQAAQELRAELPGDRLRPVSIDVTSEESIADAHKLIHDEVGDGGLLGLVNNAGISVSAPLECVPLDDLRNQLEVNLVGVAAMIRQFLPLLRISGTPAPAGPVGRIVNVTSGVGRVALPYMGAYAASQFGKEGLSDALRRELAPQRISVSVIEPGAIATPIWDKQARTATRLLEGAPEPIAALYRDRFTAFAEANAATATSGTTAPADVARAVEHALTARRPRIRYRVGRDVSIGSLAARLLPDRVLDLAITRSL
ncbi:SDR family NAD(P)-dependent oxidoreductase [Nocardia transvalensis]|uniref:SDR family NAD(P)-dependent oxidoreductase n=1 Tax=Nocardia transvalensis TaxID=37333 RepID=UPI001E4BD0C2|nr:SDR family NAD(P)-dependent oxidoreductase [Nocardia transvalensis]